VGIWVIIYIQKPSLQFFQTFRPLRMFKDCVPREFTLSETIVFILSTSACSDRIGYSTDFCSMIKVLHVLKAAVVNTETFRHLIMFQLGKRTNKSLLDFYT